ncbi:MAG TPA: ABC transporter substrate-binding protein [Methylomirabilota bacterium]|nr:ABC transporter substrate-binding protein [Methylomirabilota bacterium]
MMNRRRAIAMLGLALVALVLGPTTTSADNTQGITDTTIRIGSIGPYTGDNSSYSALNYGPLAYFRYVNSQGGVHGRKFEVVAADDACKEATGIAAAKKLIYQDKVFMLLVQPCSGVAMATKPIVVEEGLPWIGVSANPKLTTPTVKNMFHVTYTGVYSGRAMARFALSKPNAKKIVLVAHTNDWAKGYCDPATAAMKEQGVEPIMNLTLERGSTDATAQSLRIKAAGADFVLGCLYEAELAILLRDLHKYSVNVPVIGALGADFESTHKRVNNPAAVKNFYLPYQFKAPMGSPLMKKWEEMFVKYLEKSELPDNGVPTNFYYFGLPTAIATVEAFKRAGAQPSREKFIAALETLKDFDTGVLADKVTITTENHVGVHMMFAVGVNEQGKQTVYTAWGRPLQ